MKPDKSRKGGNTNTLKLILRSASIFLSQKPRNVQPSEASHTSRRRLVKGASFGLATPSRRNRRNSDSESESEPDSPRVSCVGQVEIAKGKKKKKEKKNKITVDEENPERHRWIWERKMRRTSSMELQPATEKNGGQELGVGIETAPYLSQMKRFASGRGSLSDFEWGVVGGEGEPSTR